jgi:dihydroxyacetone kinase
MVSTAETESGEMAVDDGEVPIEGTRLAADEAELGVTFGGAVGAQAETIRKIPQIASSAR